MTKRNDLTEEERKEIRNEFQRWGKWMIATILLMVGLIVYDANTAHAQGYADQMETYEVCKWKGSVSHFMTVVYNKERKSDDYDRENINFFMGREPTSFEQKIIDNAIKRVHQLIDKGESDPQKISDIIAGECMTNGLRPEINT